MSTEKALELRDGATHLLLTVRSLTAAELHMLRMIQALAGALVTERERNRRK
jgi:hypothetical protein